MSFYCKRLSSHLFKGYTKPFQNSYRRFSTIRNVAVVAHVDHGKTTLVDGFLKCSGESLSQSRTMDRHELERERGITIASKVTRVDHKGNIFNIVDTPGHADFGGEVERILNIVDCVCLLVDVVEGPKPQTGFVLKRALENPNMTTVVIVNKCDRECNKTQSDIENELFDLYVDCCATDKQLEFPILYVSAKNNWVSKSFPVDMKNVTGISTILDVLLETAPNPKVDSLEYFTFQAGLLDFYDGCSFITGKVNSGTISKGASLYVSDPMGNKKGQLVVKDILVAKLAERTKLTDAAKVGDIITLQCHKGIIPEINDTLSSRENFDPLPPVKIAEPVISVMISANSSPLAGTDGKYRTTADIGKRLKKESRINLTIQVEETPEKDAYYLKGRGELQIGVILENMRREGYEMTVSPLAAILSKDEHGNAVEAFQQLVVVTPSELASGVVELLLSRGVELVSYSENQGGTEKYRTLEFHGSISQLLGLIAPLNDITRGRGDITLSTIDYRPVDSNQTQVRKNGCLIASCSGVTTAFALEPAMSKGTLFVSEGTQVYAGMIIGESGTDKDLHLNVVKTKPVTGMRNKGHEQIIKIVYKQPTVEQALAFITNDEQIELTPKRIAIRKKLLSKQ
ncbi:bifunctional GTP-binding protein TypA-BipA [Babesia duncani]|uniref:Bifunctional GTP-binding protein TypA-BipA n=1 Tax=Babesia duncani TaxID=323732 RepID=A0AAD9UMV3_9APIC|nr:bifunctional GTP-binding protein TypA-BipA [Babesia duncani]